MLHILRQTLIKNRFYCTKSKNKPVEPKKINTFIPLSSKNRVASAIDRSKLPPRTKITAETIAHLERLSLVDCANKEGIQTLEEAIAFADQILQVDTVNVEPLVTVLENQPLVVRDDEVREGNCRQEILSNAAVTEEEYFVVPPGNVPLEPRENLLHEKVDNDSQTNKYLVGPMGTLLMENLKSEWLSSFINSKDHSIFYCQSNFVENYDYIRNLCQSKLPFGIAEFVKEKNINMSLEKDLGAFINEPTKLKCTVFVAPTNPTYSLHQWQRQRRMWWKKFSLTPSRYFTTDIVKESTGVQRIDIYAKYSFGDYIVESVRLSENHPQINSEQLQNKHDRKTLQAINLTSDVNLGTMYINSLCDAFEVLKHQNEDRNMFKLHRKLAPYKVAFSIPKTNKAQIGQDLKDLATYLCKKLRAANISSLLLAHYSKETLDRQFKNYDELGVPYTVLLNENTLKDGILFLRSRDTSIKEHVHMTELQNYFEMLFKNY